MAKNNRKQFRMSDDTTSYLSMLSERIGYSEAKIVDIAIFLFYQDRNNFIIAPEEIGGNWFLKMETPINEGVMEFVCKKGRMWVDVETWEILKVKEDEV